MFVDGLRLDVARELERALREQGMDATLAATWAPVPSVTASGKLLCSPVAHFAQGRGTDQDFVPSHADRDRPFNTALLRKVLKEEGWQVLGPNQSGDAGGRAWTEFGDLDHYGHEHGLRLAREVPVILEAIIEQLRFLMDAGWQSIRIVTDHGWLLVPGGMPKTVLAKFLTATRWGRCASLTDTASPTELTLTWSWCPELRIAMAPGISSFIAGQEYGHGGLSLQESVIPILRVSRPVGGKTETAVEFKQVKWAGLRCRVTIDGAQSGFQLDLRRKASDCLSSVAVAAKALKAGKAALVVEDDELEGEAVSLVVLDSQGQVIARMATVIGGDD